MGATSDNSGHTAMLRSAQMLGSPYTSYVRDTLYAIASGEGNNGARNS